MTELAKCSLEEIETLIKNKRYLKKLFDDEQEEGSPFFNAISYATLKGEAFRIRHGIVKSIISRSLEYVDAN